MGRVDFDVAGVPKGGFSLFTPEGAPLPAASKSTIPQYKETTMEITEIRVTKGIKKNLGDYNSVHAEISLIATVPEGDNPAEAIKELFASASLIVAAEVGEAPATNDTPTELAPTATNDTPTELAPTETKTSKWNKLAAKANEEMKADDAKAEETPVEKVEPKAPVDDGPLLDRGDFNKEVGILVKRLGAAKVMGSCAAFSVSKVADIPDDQRRAFLAAVCA